MLGFPNEFYNCVLDYVDQVSNGKAKDLIRFDFTWDEDINIELKIFINKEELKKLPIEQQKAIMNIISNDIVFNMAVGSYDLQKVCVELKDSFESKKFKSEKK